MEEEQQSTTSQRVGVRIVSSGVGRPRIDTSEDLLEALHVTADFRWADGKISSRTSLKKLCGGGGTNLGLLAQHRPLLT